MVDDCGTQRKATLDHCVANHLENNLVDLADYSLIQGFKRARFVLKIVVEY
jgi:hypothetical protein